MVNELRTATNTSKVANDADHTRYRRSLAHAFSDSALREQEQLLNSFFDIFIEQLDKKIDGDDHGKLNLTRWLNYLTFDIIGELAFGRSFSALEGDDTRWYISNIFQSLKVIRWVRVGSKYPLVFALFKFLAYFKPELARARKEVIEYAKENVNNRLNTETDKKDFLSYVSLRTPYRCHQLLTATRCCITMTRKAALAMS